MKRVSILILGLALIGSKAWAFPNGCGMGPDPSIAAELHLSDNQKTTIASLHESFQKELCPLQNQLLSKKGELAQLWMQTDPDLSRIEAKQQEIRDIQSRLQERATYYHLKCRQVLSLEQRKKLAEMRRK